MTRLHANVLLGDGPHGLDADIALEHTLDPEGVLREMCRVVGRKVG